MIFEPRRSAAFYDNDNLKMLQRAYEGACWSLGIAPHPRTRQEASQTIDERDRLAKAVIDGAGRGKRSVQALKADAVRALRRAPKTR